MAKGNIILGSLRGSVGDMTFSRVQGKQIVKGKATTVRNPRTSKQTYQRMFFSTIAKAQSAMKQIIDHSFETVQHGQKSLQYFSQRNIALARQAARFDTVFQTWVAPSWSYVTPRWTSFAANKYRISEGSLPDAMMDAPDFIINNWPQPAGGGEYNINSRFNPRTSFPFFCNFSVAPWRTYEMLEGAIEQVNAKPGDYMTICLITAKQDDVNLGAGVQYPCYFHFIRLMFVEVNWTDNNGETTTQIHLLPSNIDGVQYFWEPRYNIKDAEANKFLSSLNDGEFDVMFVGTQESSGNPSQILPYIDLHYMFNISYMAEADLPFVSPLHSDDVILAGTWIHSRPESAGTIRVSTQDMKLIDPTGDVYDLNLGLQDAYDEWTNITKSVGNDSYILEGGGK